jgi:hypothetical protein
MPERSTTGFQRPAPPPGRQPEGPRRGEPSRLQSPPFALEDDEPDEDEFEDDIEDLDEEDEDELKYVDFDDL